MKHSIKKIMSLVLCIGLLHSPLQANPFKEFCRKWVSRYATVYYWGALSVPAAITAAQVSTTINLWDVFNNNQDVKQDGPEMYARTQNILKEEGLKGLDEYRMYRVNINGDSSQWASIGDKKIMVPATAFRPASVYDFVYAEKSEQNQQSDAELTAAILSHEMAHGDNNDHATQGLLRVTTPFAIHAAGRGIYNSVVGPKPKPNPGSYPTITRSYLRMYRAGMIVATSYLFSQWHSRECERRADASLKNSPKLLLKLAEYLKKNEEHDEVGPVLQLMAMANVCIPPEFLEGLQEESRRLYKDNPDLFVQAADMLYPIRSHPKMSERIAYLKQWAAEAEAKQESAK